MSDQESVSNPSGGRQVNLADTHLRDQHERQWRDLPQERNLREIEDYRTFFNPKR
jgi:hypothetical protein